MVNRAGLSMREAYEERPPWEVEALLMSQIAEAEANRPAHHDEPDTIEPYNPEGVAAPKWVDELDAE